MNGKGQSRTEPNSARQTSPGQPGSTRNVTANRAIKQATPVQVREYVLYIVACMRAYYHTAETFGGEHFRVSVQNDNFMEKTFDDFQGPIIMYVGTATKLC